MGIDAQTQLAILEMGKMMMLAGIIGGPIGVIFFITLFEYFFPGIFFSKRGYHDGEE